MNVKSLKIAVKGIREIFRDRKGFVLLLVLPVLFIAVFSFAFGSGTFQAGGSLPHDIVVVNYDSGITVISNNTTCRDPHRCRVIGNFFLRSRQLL
jgi:ABC-type Na+ efflux pump permease subunit